MLMVVCPSAEKSHHFGGEAALLGVWLQRGFRQQRFPGAGT